MPIRSHFQVAELSGEKAQKAGMFEKMSLARTMKREGDAALALNPKNAECLSAMMLTLPVRKR